MRRLLFITMIFLTCGVSPEATARPMSDKSRAKKLFAQGNRLFAKNKVDAALVKFKKAYELWQHPTILYNIAVAHAVKGDVLEAAIQARTYLKQRPTPKDKLPEVLIKALNATGVLTIQVPDPQAAIHVDGKLVGQGRVQVTVLAGDRMVDVRKNRQILGSTTVTVPPDGEKTWELAELPRPRPRPRPREIKVTPRVAVVPVEPRVTPAVPREVPRDTPSKRWQRLHWAYVTAGAGVTVAALAGAVVTSFLTKKAKEDNDKNPTPDTKSKGEKMQTIANAMWGVTAAAAVGTAVVAIFTRWKGKKPVKERAVAPVITPGGIGIVASF